METRRSQVITCKAAVIWGIGEELKIEEIQVEAPQPTEVRVKMLCASICHTDITRAHGFPLPLFPRVLGHEGVGVVESIGEKVKGIEEGDIVIPTLIAECEQCENCLSAETNLCLNYPINRSGLMADGSSRMSIRGQKLYQLFTCSTWSEYMVVDSSYVFKIDPCIPFHHASFISCGFTTGFGAAWKEPLLQCGSTVAVFGLGAVGLGAVEGARMKGASKIIGVDVNENKKGKGETFGITEFINPRKFDKPISELVKDLTHDGVGVDYCFECSGANLVNQAIRATKLGRGKTIVMGSGSESMEIETFPLLAGRVLKGSVFGGIKIKSELAVILEKCKNKELQLDELLTHEIEFKDMDKAFELLKQPHCVKLLINF